MTGHSAYVQGRISYARTSAITAYILAGLTLAVTAGMTVSVTKELGFGYFSVRTLGMGTLLTGLLLFGGMKMTKRWRDLTKRPTGTSSAGLMKVWREGAWMAEAADGTWRRWDEIQGWIPSSPPADGTVTRGTPRLDQPIVPAVREVVRVRPGPSSPLPPLPPAVPSSHVDEVVGSWWGAWNKNDRRQRTLWGLAIGARLGNRFLWAGLFALCIFLLVATLALVFGHMLALGPG